MNRRVSSSFRQSLSFIEEADELFFLKAPYVPL